MWQYLKDYLPALATIIVGVITVSANLFIGVAKQRSENKSAQTNYGDSLRDDLLAQVDKYETRLQAVEKQLEAKDRIIEDKNRIIEAKDELLRKAYSQITDQYSTIADLNIEIRKLREEVRELRVELDRFNNKVYFVPKEDTS